MKLLENNEVAVQREWLKRFIELKDKIVNDPKGKAYDWTNHLLGYIESGRTLLK